MDTTIESVGEPKIDSPLKSGQFVDDTERVLYDISARTIEQHLKDGRSLLYVDASVPDRVAVKAQ